MKKLVEMCLDEDEKYTLGLQKWVYCLWFLVNLAWGFDMILLLDLFESPSYV